MSELDPFAACRKSAALVQKQIQASHALGKFIVDSVLDRVGRFVRQQAPDKSTSVMSSALADSQSEPADVQVDDAVGRLPIPESEFALLTSADVVALVNRSSTDDVRAIGEYEMTHRRRRLVIEAVKAKTGS